MIIDKLSEILTELLLKSGGSAVFIFSCSGEDCILIDFESIEKNRLKMYEQKINKTISSTMLNKSGGFYKDYPVSSPLIHSIEKENLLIHLFPSGEEFEQKNTEKIISDISNQIVSGVNFRKYALQMKYAEYMEAALVLKDFHGNVRYCNSQAVKLFESNYANFINANEAYRSFFEIKIDENFNRHLDRAISAGFSEINLSPVTESKSAYFRISSRFIKEENLLLDIISTVSEEKPHQDNLQNKFQELIEAYNDLAFFLDRNGYFQVINTNGAHLLGYKTEDIVGKHFLEFVSDKDKAEIALIFQNILTSHKHLTFEAKLSDIYSNKIVFQIFGNPVYTNNKVSGFLGFGKDLSKILSLEEKISQLNTKLIEANRLISIEKDRAREQMNVLEEINKLKNEFISTISHELRTPLASIVGFAETITSDNSLPVEMIHEFTGIILNEGKRLAKLVNDILDFSKLESIDNPLNIEEFDLISILKELIRSYESAAAEKNITINSKIPEAEIFISADKEKITKALSVILNNSIKYNNTGGRVSVIVNDFLNEFEVIIIDTGIGISEKEIPKLFQKFSKIQANVQNQGPGFGLVTAKQIIDMHKGIIRVKSEINKGSTFIVRLPKNNLG